MPSQLYLLTDPRVSLSPMHSIPPVFYCSAHAGPPVCSEALGVLLEAVYNGTQTAIDDPFLGPVLYKPKEVEPKVDRPTTLKGHPPKSYVIEKRDKQMGRNFHSGS